MINKDDPLLNYWEKLHNLDALDLRIMDNVGMEFTSELIWRWANEYLQNKDKGRTCCWKTESKENKSNKAIYEEFPHNLLYSIYFLLILFSNNRFCPYPYPVSIH